MLLNQPEVIARQIRAESEWQQHEQLAVPEVSKTCALVSRTCILGTRNRYSSKSLYPAYLLASKHFSKTGIFCRFCKYRISWKGPFKGGPFQDQPDRLWKEKRPWSTVTSCLFFFQRPVKKIVMLPIPVHKKSHPLIENGSFSAEEAAFLYCTIIRRRNQQKDWNLNVLTDIRSFTLSYCSSS